MTAHERVTRTTRRTRSTAQAGDSRRVSVRVAGTVQGVGFRPYVYRLAHALHLGGFVLNDAGGVAIEVQGSAENVGEFLDRLPREVPPLAIVDHVAVTDIALGDNPGTDAVRFDVVETDRAGEVSTLVSPDTATCDDCLRELFDPDDRRYRYPFINCTNCGPRFSIVRNVPYDRPFTTMVGFRMCARCAGEYGDPGDRRFHAQPNACSACGPAARLLDAGGNVIALGNARDFVQAAATALLGGAIVAVKGVGGYHLSCRADDSAAVARLRARKHREEKPFAVMVPDLLAARDLVVLDAAEERLLTSRARPIVLAARRRAGCHMAAGVADGVADGVAPGHRDLGIVLPYTPLHHVLLADVDTALVMTSGNRSDEPIAFRDDDALERLAGIADFFLVHDRPIQTRVDDSVARVVCIAGERRPLMLRRSRGYVPSPITLPVRSASPVLACGGHLKNTFCLVRGDHAIIGPHIGDLENLETLLSFGHGIEHVANLFGVEPGVVAHDLHPDYLSTKFALEREESGAMRATGVQHHHAHLAACLAEHGETGPAVGLIFDGTGFGLDGTVWGGEVLVGDLTGFDRVGGLLPVRMPGGAAAIREPWRMACAWLVAIADDTDDTAGADGAPPTMPPWLRARVDAAQWAAVARLARTGLASPITTSAGRLLDAVAALCGIRTRVSYEGQAAIELEMSANPLTRDRYGLSVRWQSGQLVLDPRDMIRAVISDMMQACPVDQIAARTHGGLAYATATMGILAAERSGLDTVVLAGGVFQNVLLLERTAAHIVEAGYRVLVPARVPPNDGGLSFGQAAVAAARDARRVTRTHDDECTPSR